MNTKYATATENDVEIICELANTIWKKYYPAIITIEQIEYMLQKMYSAESILKQMEAGHKFTLAFFNDLPVGYISVSKKNDDCYFLHKFYIDTEKHRLGVGSDFFQFIVSNLPKNTSLELTVNRQNFKAINFYFKNGFIIKEVADFDIGNGYAMNDFVMVRNL